MDWKSSRMFIGLAALVGLGVATYLVIADKTGDTAPTVGSEDIALPEIDREAITELEIHRPDDDEAITLVRGEDGWFLGSTTGPVAATSAIDTVLDKLTEMELSGVAATRAQHHERLEVDDAHAVHVIARAGSETAIEMWLGAFRGGNTMVRLEGNDRVLGVRGSIKFAFNKPVRDWRDREITSLTVADVHDLSFSNENGEFSFHKGEDWEQVLPEPIEGEEPPTAIEGFSPGKVTSLVSSLARLRASDFGVDVEPQAIGLGEGGARVTIVSGADDEEQTTVLLVGSETEGDDHNRYLMIEGNDTIFIVSSFIGERLLPNAEAFVQGEEPEAPAGAPGMPPGMPGMPPGMPGMPPGMGGPGGPGGGQIPPELMRQIQQQLQQQGGGQAPPPPAH